jgi:mannose-6-phosphate isomerase-like protein (cupin superfamily)
MKTKHLGFGHGFRVAFANARAQAAEMVIAPGAAEGGTGNRHRGADQWLFVVSGRGTATVDGRTIALKRGTLLLIERRQEHRIRNDGRTLLKTLNLYLPPAYDRRGNALVPGKR